MNLSIAQSVAALIKSIRKMDSYKGARNEYKSISHVCNEIKTLWDVERDGVKFGYHEAFEALGVTSIDFVTPKLLTQCHPDLTTVEDGKTYETIHRAVNVYMTDANGRVMRDKDDKKIKKLDKENKPIFELKTYLVTGWSPETLIQYIAEDRTLRILDYAKVIRKKSPKLTEKQVMDAAEKQYLDYVAAKFAPKEEKPKKTRKLRTKKSN